MIHSITLLSIRNMFDHEQYWQLEVIEKGISALCTWTMNDHQINCFDRLTSADHSD